MCQPNLRKTAKPLPYIPINTCKDLEGFFVEKFLKEEKITSQLLMDTKQDRRESMKIYGDYRKDLAMQFQGMDL